MNRFILAMILGIITVAAVFPTSASACAVPGDVDYSVFRSAKTVIVGRVEALDYSGGSLARRHLTISVDEVIAGRVPSSLRATADGPHSGFGVADRGDGAWLGHPLILVLQPNWPELIMNGSEPYVVPEEPCGHPYILLGTPKNIELIRSWRAGDSIDPPSLDAFQDRYEDVPNRFKAEQEELPPNTRKQIWDAINTLLAIIGAGLLMGLVARSSNPSP